MSLLTQNERLRSRFFLSVTEQCLCLEFDIVLTDCVLALIVKLCRITIDVPLSALCQFQQQQNNHLLGLDLNKITSTCKNILFSTKEVHYKMVVKNENDSKSTQMISPILVTDSQS